jgi:GDP-L-fucose synthase
VTGGTGFVGTHLVKALLALGAQVRITVHQRAPLLHDRRVEIVAADLTRQDDCVAAMQGVDFVFHAAGSVGAAGVAASDAMASITGNLILTSQVLQAAWATGVERILVFGSSTGYPACDRPVREEEFWSGPPHPSYFGYGWMRRYVERMAEFVASRSQTKVALVRPTAVYGHHDDFRPTTSHVIPALVRKAVERMTPFEVWGTGEEVRDFLHVEDLARGCLLMMEKHAECDPVNIGYGEGVSIRRVAEIILAAAGHTVDAQFDRSKPTTIPVRLVDTSKARRLLGFTPAIPLEAGLSDLVQWYAQTQRQVTRA